MNRTKSSEAIVLSQKAAGENNTLVTLLTPSDGIVMATLYGGPKSRLRSYITLWNRGIVWLYDNPQKNQVKITDFEVRKYHTTFSENLFKFYAASLAAEISIKTRAAGTPSSCFHLVGGFFDGMDLCGEEQSRLGLLRFLWRFLELLGVQPSSHCCGMCGKSFLDTDTKKSYYNVGENNFICQDCGEGSFELSGASLQYLAALSVLPPAQARKMQIDERGFEQIKQVIFFLIESSIDQKLNSIESGRGIL